MTSFNPKANSQSTYDDVVNSTQFNPYHQRLDNYAKEVKGKTGLKRIASATIYSIDGSKATYTKKATFRQILVLHLMLLIVITFVTFYLAIKIMLIAASFLSLIVELLNTAVEASVNHASTEQHPLAKIVKNAGSAAQFLSLILLCISWSIALFTIL